MQRLADFSMNVYYFSPNHLDNQQLLWTWAPKSRVYVNICRGVWPDRFQYKDVCLAGKICYFIADIVFAGVSPHISLAVSLYLYISLFIPVFLSLFLHFSLYLYTSLYISIFLSLPLYFSLYIHISLFIFIFLSLYISLPLSVFIYNSLSIS